jgi:hypothetical protein
MSDHLIQPGEIVYHMRAIDLRRELRRTGNP